jgi:hypothetical protein
MKEVSQGSHQRIAVFHIHHHRLPWLTSLIIGIRNGHGEIGLIQRARRAPHPLHDRGTGAVDSPKAGTLACRISDGDPSMESHAKIHDGEQHKEEDRQYKGKLYQRLSTFALALTPSARPENP